MSVWERYSKEQREKYIEFLQVYGALSNLFRQKQGDLIPYLDSKFQETVFAKIFNSQNVDTGNTPHDVLSVFGNDRIGIGLKTWMSSTPSFQKVMQLKRFQEEINDVRKTNDKEALALKISEIKNERMRIDYQRLGLSEDKNIYHYITRDKGLFVINECAYPLIDVEHLQNFDLTSTAFSWSDGRKDYKFTFGDSQIWQKFDSSKNDTLLLHQFNVNIIEDPFSFLLKAYTNFLGEQKCAEEDTVEVYLPLYSYALQKVKEKSGLNVWNAASKNKGSNTPRPSKEIYIPIPRKFHKKYPHFFIKDIFNFEKEKRDNKELELRFHLELPNGKRIPALVTQDNMKALQSGSNTEIDPETGKLYGQSALGRWLLVDVLGLKERELVTREWLEKKGTDSVRLWRKKDDYSTFYIDFAPVNSFENFMKGTLIENEE